MDPRIEEILREFQRTQGFAAAAQAVEDLRVRGALSDEGVKGMLRALEQLKSPDRGRFLGSSAKAWNSNLAK